MRGAPGSGGGADMRPGCCGYEPDGLGLMICGGAALNVPGYEADGDFGAAGAGIDLRGAAGAAIDGRG